jgi:putative endonuclease
VSRRGQRSGASSVEATARGRDRRAALGRLGEELATTHLEQLGFRVLARNVRTRQGEIDVIAFDGHTLVFAEVKTRHAGARGGAIRPDQEPLWGLGARQRARLRRLAAAWLRDRGAEEPFARAIRFDALGVIVDGSGALRRLEHIEQAW